MNITKRDKELIVACLLLAPSAELGDTIGGHDGHTKTDRISLATKLAKDWGLSDLEQMAHHEALRVTP